MILSLIGMSNSGKTRWAKRLEVKQGFVRFSCDDMIAKELEKRYPEIDLTDMDAFAAWMGMPFDPGYHEREAAYLAQEETVLEEILKKIPLLLREASGVVTSDIVIDTTGSVIYLPPSVLDALSRLSKVVYLDVGEAQMDQMRARFFSHPKPLVWSKAFNVQQGEPHDQALIRCYPELLRFREGRYRALAHVTVPYAMRQNPGFDLYAFLLDQQS